MTTSRIEPSGDGEKPSPSCYGAYGLSDMRTDTARTSYAGETFESALNSYVLGGRIYIPWLRRFLAPDPASPFDVGGLNRYAYCLGDPINRIDPSGNASFGWLGKLLGNLLGTIGHAAHTMAHATPTTALTVISQAAETVAVAVGIGAVAAAALDDTQAAGILGWIAAGSGLAGGLGAAGQILGKANRRYGGQTSDIHALQAPPQTSTKHWSGSAYERETFPMRGQRQIKHYIGEGAVDKFIAHRKTSSPVNGNVGPLPEWTEIPNRNGGLNWVVDTPVNHLDHRDLMRSLRQKHGKESKPVYFLVGAHGGADGLNWASGQRLHADSMLLRTAKNHRGKLARLAGVRKADFEIVNISRLNNRDLGIIMEQDAHIIHAYCYSAVDREVMFHFGVTGRTLRVFDRHLIDEGQSP